MSQWHTVELTEGRWWLIIEEAEFAKELWPTSIQVFWNDLEAVNTYSGCFNQCLGLALMAWHSIAYCPNCLKPLGQQNNKEMTTVGTMWNLTRISDLNVP